ncbi:hypothetical protein WJX81_005006 [Elliptochloris bilobata]|uniref:Uncharacterized protein n=1 Tax=Elliptochloris bilobata TaxID=381761 RepID=A0AAW1RUS4_9CHLO
MASSTNEDLTERDGLLRYNLDVGGGRMLRIISDPCHKRHSYCCGTSLWTACIEFISVIAGLTDSWVSGLRVLELGAGLGALGQALALHGAVVALTDSAVMLPLLQDNVAANFGASNTACGSGPPPEVHELAWGSSLAGHALDPRRRTFDLLVASDVCYNEDCFDVLLATVLEYLAANHRMQVVMAIPDREESRAFLARAVAAGLAFRFVRRFPARPDLPTAVSICQLCRWAGPDPGGGNAPVPGPQRILFACDFDWSLVEENSDTFVLREVGAWPAFERLQAQGLPWTALMDAGLAAAAAEASAKPADVLAACRRVPFHAAMQKAVRRVAAAPGCELVILSDANSVFIAEVLAAAGLAHCFSQVHTNQGIWEEGVLRVRPHQPSDTPHGCPNCAANLCKGQVLERLLLAASGAPWTCVVYLGDGANDACPAARLGGRDVVLARAHYPDGRPCALPRRLAAGGGRAPASVDAALAAGFRPGGMGAGGGPAGLPTWPDSAPLAQVVTWDAPSAAAAALLRLAGLA